MKRNRHFYFCFPQTQSPTVYNLKRYLQARSWRPCRFTWQANFSEKNLQFNQQAAETLEFKHLLAQLVANFCPEVMPLTFCINDENWLQILTKIAPYYLPQAGPHQQGKVWILKPALLNNGNEIKIFQNLDELERHFLSANRVGGEHVLQQYITQPHLLRDARKYSIRMFVITSNYAGNYLYPQGYLNVALHPFSPNQYTDLAGHLTNEHLQDKTENVIQIPSNRFDFFPTIYPQIKTIVQAVIKGLKALFPQAFVLNKNHQLAIYGFDFLVDQWGRVWLLEANHGPCFPIADNHPLQHYLYDDFWQNFVTTFIEPIAENKSQAEINDSIYFKKLD